MSLTQAIFDKSTQTFFERPFCFDSSHMFSGPKFDTDVAIALVCYARAGMLPTGPALLFMGNAAQGLFLRRNETRDDWDAFLTEVGRRHPVLPAHDAEVRARVSALGTGDTSGTTKVWRPTMPEVCVGSALLELMPKGLNVVADAALPGGRGRRGHVRRCDFHIASCRGELRIEVAGLLNRVGPPPTYHGAQYAQTRMPARTEAYATLGLPPPVTIYADEALDRSRLLPIVADILSQLV